METIARAIVVMAGTSISYFRRARKKGKGGGGKRRYNGPGLIKVAIQNQENPKKRGGGKGEGRKEGFFRFLFVRLCCGS